MLSKQHVSNFGNKRAKCLVPKCKFSGSLKGLCRKHYHNFKMYHHDKSISEFVEYANNRVDYQKNPMCCIVAGCLNTPLAKRVMQ